MNSSTGVFPYASLVIDGSGNLYRTNGDQGPDNNGTFFEVDSGTTTPTVVASFNGTDGNLPYSGPTMDSNGNLFGVAEEGGSSNEGTVYEVQHGSNSITTLANFNGTNGKYPGGTLLIDSAGNLYGTTDTGGANGYGNVFEMVNTGTVTNPIYGSPMALASLIAASGENPEAGLVMDGSGNLYGTTFSGGANGDGTVFEVAASTHVLSTLVSFNGSDGADLYSPLTIDSRGDLFGTATYGGTGWTGGAQSGDGTVFEIPAGTSTLNTLLYFGGANGMTPRSNLYIDSSGDLYGTTLNGGSDSEGTIFEMTPSGNASAPEPPVVALLVTGAV